MPSVQGNHRGRAALTKVAIIGATQYKEHRQSERPVLEGVRPFTALIDTGATSTMITTKVVRTLGLDPVGMLAFFGLDGSTSKTAYLFHVAFYDASASANLMLDDGDQHVVEPANPIDRIRVCTAPINGGEISGDPSFDVLLGMDIISTGELIFRKGGHWRFSF